VTSKLIKPGYRHCVEIGSSNIPGFDRNHNTGHDFGAEADQAKAGPAVMRDREQPLYILPPIIPQ
jgi:predicted acyl esterase